MVDGSPLPACMTWSELLCRTCRKQCLHKLRCRVSFVIIQTVVDESLSGMRMPCHSIPEIRSSNAGGRGMHSFIYCKRNGERAINRIYIYLQKCTCVVNCDGWCDDDDPLLLLLTKRSNFSFVIVCPANCCDTFRTCTKWDTLY